MNSPLLASLIENYRWDLSLIAFAGIMVLTAASGFAVRLVPALRHESDRNAAAFKAKMEKPNYAANQKWNRKWGLLDTLVIFGVILPFCLTTEPVAWWNVLLDIFVILMVYDFFYYFTHRFVFHDNGFLGGPLVWVHSVHHRQHNPCRWDSSYIHPIEVAIGLGLYVACIAGLSLVMGKFHVATIIVTWIAFQQINLHNHNLWETDRFPFKYLNYASAMHHNHHARFTGGNYATITTLYDWMFGTLDDGNGWGKHRRVEKADAKPQGEASAEQAA